MDNQLKTIFWDFDGVLMNSNEVRNRGFLEVLKNYPKKQVDQLMDFHQRNGGLSRYVKFRYFFEQIRGESISEEKVQKWADKFSEIMLKSLMNDELLIEETIEFVVKNHERYNMHIVSGSDGNELRQICKGLEIDQYFNSIEGSPTSKKKLVANILQKENYKLSQSILVGDSINDYEAADINNIFFMAYNNSGLEKYSNAKLIFDV